MNKGYVTTALVVGMAGVYGLELRRRARARALNQQGLCARCSTALAPQTASTIQRYRTLQPTFFYCDPCAVVLRKRERIFMATFIIAFILALAIGAFQLSRT